MRARKLTSTVKLISYHSSVWNNKTPKRLLSKYSDYPTLHVQSFPAFGTKDSNNPILIIKQFIRHHTSVVSAFETNGRIAS